MTARMTTHRTSLIACVAALLVLTAALLMTAAACQQRRSNYQQAVRLSASGNAAEAYRIFDGLGDYRDAAERAAALAQADPSLPYRDSQKGDVIAFGAYEQDGDAADGAEPVEWFVLDRIDDRLLLLSVDCLASRRYNAEPFASVTWEDSELRTWLNDAFLQAAFSPTERQIIRATRLRNDDQSVVGTDGGVDTTDRVFALSHTEALIYLHDDADRDYLGRAAASDAAATGQAYVDADGMADWWLRSPGGYPYAAQYVSTTGETAEAGAYVDAEYGVRPALWLDVSEAGDGEP